MAPIVRAGKSIYLCLGETAMRGFETPKSSFASTRKLYFLSNSNKTTFSFYYLVEFPGNTITSDVQLTASENADNFFTHDEALLSFIEFLAFLYVGDSEIKGTVI